MADWVRRIQRVPTGLLGLLGIKDDGNTLPELEPRLRAVVDLTAYYQAQDLQTKIITDAATLTVGTGSNMIVPQGEYWQLLAVGGLWSGFTAASVFAACIQIGFPPNLVPVTNESTRYTITAGASDQFRIGWCPPQPFVVSPGMQISTTLLLTMAAVATPQLRVLYLKLNPT